MKKRLKKIGITISILSLVLGSIKGYAPCNNVVQADDAYEVVWEDNFDGNSLDRSVWNVEVNGNGGGNQELQYYCDTTENIEVSNGTLKIKGLRKSYGGKNYTSGRINTMDKAEFRYGKIEARIKLPSFLGAWPAFWMLGGNYSEIGWPRCGEIDIMEAINTENYTHGALHWSAEGQNDSASNSQSVLPEDFDRTQWHVYGMIWTETTIQFTVDGKVFFTEDITDGYMGEFRKEQFIILNLAIGGQWPGFNIDGSAFPVTMEVDYVRVSQRDADKNIIKGTGVAEKNPVVVPDETETRNVIEYKGPWNIFYNTTVVSGTGSSESSKGYIANIEHLGTKGRLITATIRDVEYIPGETYKYEFTIMSDIDKYVNVKVVGEDQEEDIFANYTISLQANSPYKFSEDVTIHRDYDGRLDLIIEMGGRIGGEFYATDTSLTIQMTNATFTGVAGILKEIPTQQTTTTQTVPSETTGNTEATDNTETTNKTGVTGESTTTEMAQSTKEQSTGAHNAEVTNNQSITNSNGATTTENQSAGTTTENNGVSSKDKNTETTIAANDNQTVATKGQNKKVNLKNKKVKLISAKRSKDGKNIKLKFRKVSGAQKYQIRYSTNKKVKKYKSVNTKKIQYTIKKLKPKKTYYIKVRAYNVVNGKKYYSAWSKVKKVKVKK